MAVRCQSGDEGQGLSSFAPAARILFKAATVKRGRFLFGLEHAGQLSIVRQLSKR